MTQGPTLSDNQYAVLMADGATGHVLTISAKVSLYEEVNDIYKIFQNIEAARQFIKGKQKDDDTLEFNVYNSSYEFVEYWTALKWKV